ncbi:chitinase-3-like protein 1 isoform X1 [Schistocerca nitens]|uniref:chitinase-3-like protein 1 isoform X1 n=1 Tax=Schistocerca nitens TaxID=7011 RepID=UPI002118807D|nr:chitinase-3-like protein 1 isoform X1 [Schistocerca nitens]
MSPILSGLVLLLGVLNICGADEKKVVCYHGSWSAYRNGNGRFEIEYIKPELCTHMIYSFVGITSAGEVRILDEWLDLASGKNAYNRFNKLKSSNTKTLVAIGGWNEGSATYSAVMNNAALRQKFVQNVVNFVKTYGFDGFDLDWEYPANRGGSPGDLRAYVELLKELRAEFDKHGFILSAAVGVGRYLIGSAYDVPQLSKYLDFINLMTYDLHGSWDSKTGQNAPLYASSADKTEAERQLNVDSSVRYWIQNGADPAKLILGMGTYGRTFTLASTANTGVGAPATGPGTSGPYTMESGMMGYNEICEKIKAGGWTVTWDDEQKVPYAVSGNQWVGYDNEESIKLKSQYVLDMGLGGGMIWSLETDDFKGVCGAGPFPLLSTINQVLRGAAATSSAGSSTSGSSSGSSGSSSSSSASGSASSSGTSSGSSAAGSGSSAGASSSSSASSGSSSSSGSSATSVCSSAGYARDLGDCGVFYLCVASGSGYTAHRFTCPGDLVFDVSSSACNYRSLVAC